MIERHQPTNDFLFWSLLKSLKQIRTVILAFLSAEVISRDLNTRPSILLKKS